MFPAPWPSAPLATTITSSPGERGRRGMHHQVKYAPLAPLQRLAAMSRPSRRPYFLLAFPFLLASTWVFIISPVLPHSFFSYATRPLWDTPERPKDLLPHFYSDGLQGDPKDRCELHGWNVRQDAVQVWDATIFSTEVDLLLIRLHELSDVVDLFFIMESTHTFTGLPKPLLLSTALDTPDFAPFRTRIRYKTYQGRQLRKGENPFSEENAFRSTMTGFLREHMQAMTIVPVLIFSDMDELPARRTVELLKYCEFGSPLHLGLREFLYSFEWEVGGTAESWRAQAWEWREKGNGPDEFYRHGKVTERVLVDAGWHCSWCFRTIGEFVTKATGYSHVDRLGSRPSALLRPSRIQSTICEGSDIFGMLPEAYTWREMASKWRLINSKSAVGLPSYLVQHAQKFRYLLPGGCKRVDGTG